MALFPLYGITKAMPRNALLSEVNSDLKKCSNTQLLHLPKMWLNIFNEGHFVKLITMSDNLHIWYIGIDKNYVN